MSTSPQLQAAPKPIWYRDVRVLRVIFQILFAIFVIASASWIYGNFTVQSEKAGLPTGFGFLERPTNFVVSDSPFRQTQPIQDVIRVGIRNTMAAAVVGWILATILGVLIGIGRLSTNWLVRKAAQIYVETLRNVPPLVWIIILATPIIGQFPQIQEPFEAEGLFVVSNRGLWLPWVNADGAGAGSYWWVVGAAMLAGGAVGWWRTRVNERTGAAHRRVLWFSGVAIAILAIGYVAMGAPFDIDGPVRDNRNVDGGMKLATAYAALTFGLALYTASHIAEIVRGSIQAVPNGQSEAANALALSGFQRTRYIVLPQAFRIMIPPLASQYLNYTKNTSLALAVGYSEITQIMFTVTGNGNPAVQVILILMTIYLTLSLAISFAANALNSRMQTGSFPWWTPAVPMTYAVLVWFYFGPLAGDSGGGWLVAMILISVVSVGSMLKTLADERGLFKTAVAVTTIKGA
jgi:general L-amino acid transport system permease protein